MNERSVRSQRGLTAVVAAGLLAALGFVAVQGGQTAARSVPAVTAHPTEVILPGWVAPPGAPWLLGNTAPTPPHVRWTGPALVEVDAPEDLTAQALAEAPGGIAQPHLLFTDAHAPTEGVTWVLIYTENALATTPIRITLTAQGVGAVRFGTNARSGIASASHPLPAGEASAQGLFAPALFSGRPSPGPPVPGSASRSWILHPHDVLSAWVPVEVAASPGRLSPVTVAVWEGPIGTTRLPAHATTLSPRPTDVVRTVVPHAVGTVTLPVPTQGAVAWDLDNDSPTPGGAVGGILCPAWVCLNGEVRTYNAAGYRLGADPLPGEYEPGVDPVDAPGRRPAVAVEVDGRLIRTDNYGDYGSLLRVVLRAPAGRRVYAALIPGFTHAIPWQGVTWQGADVMRWRVPAAFPPLGEGYEIVTGGREATVESTVTPGAYAPWRIVVWSEPAP